MWHGGLLLRRSAEAGYCQLDADLPYPTTWLRKLATVIGALNVLHFSMAWWMGRAALIDCIGAVCTKYQTAISDILHCIIGIYSEEAARLQTMR